MFHRDTIGQHWDELRQRMRETWLDLTNDEIAQMRGEREQVVALLERTYGWSRAEAERAADEWAASKHQGLRSR